MSATIETIQNDIITYLTIESIDEETGVEYKPTAVGDVSPTILSKLYENAELNSKLPVVVVNRPLETGSESFDSGTRIRRFDILFEFLTAHTGTEEGHLDAVNLAAEYRDKVIDYLDDSIRCGISTNTGALHSWTWSGYSDLDPGQTVYNNVIGCAVTMSLTYYEEE